MVGSAIVNSLKSKGYNNLVFFSSSDLDLRNQSKVHRFLNKVKPEIIINSAARVGGILANNTYPYEFLMDNMMIQNNLLGYAFSNNVKKFIFLGSSCIYPKYAKQPISEESLLKDALEPTNQWYALAKITGVKLIESLRIQYNRDYIALMPSNLYGPNDNFNLKTSHVIPAMIRKLDMAKNKNSDQVIFWGSGNPKREFLHVNDLADAVTFFIEKNNFSEHLVNVGSGTEISLKELANTLKNIIGFKGTIKWDNSVPDGTPRTLLNNSKLTSYGWEAKIHLKDGLESTYDWYLQNINSLREVEF